MSKDIFVGIDWATRAHEVAVLDSDSKSIAKKEFLHSGAGLAALANWLVELAGSTERIRVSIEVPHGAVVETLIERGIAVYAINPKQLDRFRDRFTMSGAKDDSRDAHVLADSLRTDEHAFRLIQLDEPEIIILREWSRIADELAAERKRMVCRVAEHLRRYFPQALKLTSDYSKTWFLDLLKAVPTPERAKRVRATTIAKILKKNRIRKHDAGSVLNILREQPVQVATGTVEAASTHIELLAQRIRLVNKQWTEATANIESLLEPKDDSLLSDAEILRSLPGIGNIICGILIGEANGLLQRQDHKGLRALAGIAPVTKRSGKRCIVVMRKACHVRLRNALYHWARIAAQCDPHWKARYAALRARGCTHGRACRGIADRLLKVAFSMLKSRTLYEPKHLQGMQQAA